LAANSHDSNGSGQIQDLSWRVGGPQGSGVDSASLIFQRSCGVAGLHLFGRREYYSNIMGRHSYYDVRVSELPPTCHRDTVDLLTTFEAETLTRHILAVHPGGGIIHTVADADVALDKITYLDERYRLELEEYLAERDLPPTTAGLLQDAENRGVNHYPVEFEDIVTAIAENLGIERKLAQKTKNTLAVAVSTALLRFPREYVEKALAQVWPGRQKIIDLNVEAVEQAYTYVAENFDTSHFDIDLHGADVDEKRLIVNGNQAVALGKLAGGLAFQSYYPISPATDESVFLEGHEEFNTVDGNKANVLVVQTEDEISAVTMAAGAALTGARSSTATSGPGFALMCEGIGWAAMNEVPLVITDWQRGAPSTGMPTRTEQGDLRIAAAASHGDIPVMIVASGDLVECFYDAADCFNYADRYQTVVMHMVDKALSSQTRTLPYYALENVKIERGEVAEPRGAEVTTANDGAFHRFEPTESGVSPRTFLGQPGNAHWTTGGEHTVEGRVVEDPVIRETQMEKRMRKMETALREIPLEEKFKIYGDRDAELTLLGWGSTKGAIQEVLAIYERRGIPVRFIQARLILPFPVEEVRELVASASPLVSIECNYGAQYTELLRAHACIVPDHTIVKYNGRPISGEELVKAVDSIREGSAESRIVLRNPHQ
jgi:2-oxoglutarate ferredoxin oxidoreductase subunit alpha